MSFRGCGGTWKVPHKAEEGGSWGKHGFTHGSETVCNVAGQSPATRARVQGASDAHARFPTFRRTYSPS